MKFLLLSGLLFFQSLVMAAEKQPYVNAIDMTKGLPSNNVYDILQDKQGFIWLATEDGICRYDGIYFKRYYAESQTSKAGSYLQQDDFGRIWYCNFDGHIYYIESDSLHEFNPQFAPYYFRYGIISNHLFCVSGSRLLYFDLSSFQLKKTASVKNDFYVTSYAFKNCYYLITDSIYVFNASAEINQAINYSNSLKGFSLMIPFNDSMIGIGNAWAKNLFYHVNANTIVPYKGKSSFININDVSIIHDKLWIATPLGAFAYDNNLLLTDSVYTHRNISKVYHDLQNNLWISTLGDGVFCIQKQHQFQTQLENNEPTSLLKIGDKTVVGTLQGQLWEYDNAKMSCHHLINAELNKEIYELCWLDKSKTIKARQLMQHEYSGGRLLLANRGIKNLEIFNNDFIAFAQAGCVSLFQFQYSENFSWTEYFKKKLIASKYLLTASQNEAIILTNVRCKFLVYNQHFDALFAATNKGLIKLSPKDSCEIQWQKKSIYTKQIASFQNHVFVLLNNGSLLIIGDNNRLTAFSKNVPVHFIKNTESGLCVINDNGIYLLNEKLLLQLISNVKISEKINDIVIDKNRIILAAKSGIINISIDSVQSSLKTYPLIIDEILVNGKMIKNFGSLNHNENNIEIHFAMPNPSGSLHCNIFYAINDGSWQPISDNSHALILASLSPGDYAIKFKVNDQLQTANVNFTIQFPWWQRWWFIFICLMLLFVGVILIYQIQMKTTGKRNQLEIEKMELEKNLRQSMLSSIKSQMNPHFLFNALNTIQSFIISEDKKNASNYLSKFSKLTRMILEMSEHETISLREEIDSLQLYLDLEKMRFEDLSSELMVDSNISIDEVKIPSMIIQPYVENAIKHGLLHKKQNRILKISFTKSTEGLLQIYIDDNGIGRQKSSELNKIKNTKHRSFSTSANLKRIELLNKENESIGVEYIDKPNDSGTGVIIKVPIYY